MPAAPTSRWWRLCCPVLWLLLVGPVEAVSDGESDSEATMGGALLLLWLSEGVLMSGAARAAISNMVVR
jgi:hypothetical protein